MSEPKQPSEIHGKCSPGAYKFIKKNALACGLALVKERTNKKGETIFRFEELDYKKKLRAYNKSWSESE